MSQPLVVHVNRGDHHVLEPASARHETGGPFVVRLQNHGEGCHVHLSLSGEIARAGTVDDPNPFLAPESVLEVPIQVETELRPARGELEVSTGYGRESVTVDVLVRDEHPTSPVPRDTGEDAGGSDVEDISPRPETGGTSSFGVDRLRGAVDDLAPTVDEGTAALLGLAILAVVVAALAAELISGPVVLLGVIVVLATVVGAGVYLLTQ